MKRIEFSPKRQYYALWLFVSDKGNLVLDHYDHSEELKEATGDECDWFVVVYKDFIPLVIAALQSENALLKEPDADMALLNSIKAKGIRGHKDYEAWLESHDIPFHDFLYTGYGPEPDV